MDEAGKEILREIHRLLWSIGDSFDEMDRSGRNLWSRIEDTENRIREAAGHLPESGATGQLKRRILETRFLHIWWSNISDMTEELIGQDPDD